jgi:zinc and cadmium transporter
MNLIGDGVHNLIDGMLIGASYCVSIPIGIATTLAVVLHEIPQEIGDFGVLVHGGLSVKKALAFNFLSAVTAILGALISLVIGPHLADYSLSLLPITAGGFIYIAGSDLIPELQHEVKLSNSILQFSSIILGVGVMALLVLLE